MWNQLKTLLLFGALTALLVGIGGALAPSHLSLFLGIALVMNLGAYFFSHKLVLAMSHARELPAHETPELHAMVRELAREAAIPVPRVYLVPSPQPNAFATGRNPAHGVVAVTEGLLGALDRRELRGVIAHELAHIKNRDVLIATVAAVIASAITTIANVLSFGAMFGHAGDDDDRGGALSHLALLLIAPLAAVLIQLAISRSRELSADATGARLTGDPDALASALVRLDRTAKTIPVAANPATASLYIVNPLGALETLQRWFSTHPPLAERVARLREMPARRSLPPRLV